MYTFCLNVFIFVVLRDKMDNNKPFSDRSAASRSRRGLSGPENDEKSDEILQDFTFKRRSLSQCSRCKYPRLLQYEAENMILNESGLSNRKWIVQ